jgi:hypothetical protein
MMEVLNIIFSDFWPSHELASLMNLCLKGTYGENYVGKYLLLTFSILLAEELLL